VRAFDGELALGARDRLADRPLQARLGAEQPGDEAGEGDDEQQGDATGPQEGARAQKP